MSKKKNKRASSLIIAKNLQRKMAIAEGYYDGRFKEKTIKDKKKEYKRTWARRKGKEEE